MTRSMLNRYEREQERLLLATLPTCGVVEYIDLIPRVPLTGRTWRKGAATLKLTTKGVAS